VQGENPGGVNILRSPEWDAIQTKHKHLEESNPNEYWRKVTDEFWETVNKPWLESAISRGDNIRLVSNPGDPRAMYTNKKGRFILDDNGEKIPSLFAREINLLKANGYLIGDDGIAYKP
jgi:hypothetical protein